MNSNAAIPSLPVKRTIIKPGTAITRYINTNSGQAGIAYLYKVVHKNLAAQNSATVCFIILPLQKKINGFIKRAIDIFFSLIVITGVLWWLVPVMAVLIKAGSRGPVFFLQKRNKQNGDVFTCIKFRSMVVNAGADILPAEQNDKRITGLGKIIRKTFIDELPQFINVLLGDMSVIGPRPHMLSENLKFEEQVPHYSYREKVKPGITGLSQIMGLSGAADTIQKMQDRTEVDIFYIRNWSFKLDMIILYRTIYKTFGW